MKILTQVQNISEISPNIAVALGTFDGVHIGHRQIITKAVNLAKAEQGTSVVFTFSNHPLEIIAPKRCPLQITTTEQKAELLAELGVDILLTIPFTREFLHISAEDFIKLLVKNLQPRHIVVGPNYSFGYKSIGTPEMLHDASRQYGFSVHVEEAITEDTSLVSSTRIRQLVRKGQVERAAKLLSRPFSITGKVIHGAKRGRKMGYPTVNIELRPGMLLPTDGVYAVMVKSRSARYHGVANMGTNPTFTNGTTRHLEAYILDFSGNLYDETLTLEFIKFLRPETAFASAEALKQQISEDVRLAKAILQV